MGKNVRNFPKFTSKTQSEIDILWSPIVKTKLLAYLLYNIQLLHHHLVHCCLVVDKTEMIFFVFILETYISYPLGIKFTITMIRDLLNLYVLVSISKNLLNFVKIVRFLLKFSKSFSFYESLYFGFNQQECKVLRLWAGIFLLNFSKNLIFYTKFSKHLKMTI